MTLEKLMHLYNTLDNVNFVSEEIQELFKKDVTAQEFNILKDYIRQISNLEEISSIKNVSSIENRYYNKNDKEKEIKNRQNEIDFLWGNISEKIEIVQKYKKDVKCVKKDIKNMIDYAHYIDKIAEGKQILLFDIKQEIRIAYIIYIKKNIISKQQEYSESAINPRLRHLMIKSYEELIGLVDHFTKDHLNRTIELEKKMKVKYINEKKTKILDIYEHMIHELKNWKEEIYGVICT